MKVKVIGHRCPWLDGKPREHGYTTTVDADLGKQLIANGLAEEVATRARKDDGTYQGDDPATPDVNEAFEPPKKRKAPAKKKAAK